MSAQPVPPTLVRISQASEVLSYVPHALGFAPERSLVVLSLRPPRGRLGLVARVDLADVTGPHGGAVLTDLGRHLVQDGAAESLAAIYVPTPVERARRDPSLLRLLASLSEHGLPPVRDVWVVGQDGYVSLLCTDPECCPAGGRPLSSLEGTRVAAAMVVAGSAPRASRDQLRIGRSGDQAACRAFETARRRARRDGDGADPAATARTAVDLLVDPAASDADLGRVAAAVTLVRVRDLVLVAVCVPGEGRDLDHDLEVMFGPDAAVPERTRIDPALANLVRAAELARGRSRARILGMLAWCAWWAGDGAQARLAIEAVDDAIGDSLAGLVRQAIDGGLAPGWVRPGSGSR